MSIKGKILTLLFKLKFNHELNKWKLHKHPLTWRDWQVYFIFFLMALPTIIMGVFLQVLRNIWASIALFHLTCIIGSFLYIIIYQQLLLNKIKKGVLLDRSRDIISFVVGSINDSEDDYQYSPTSPLLSQSGFLSDNNNNHSNTSSISSSSSVSSNTSTSFSSSPPSTNQIEIVSSKWYRIIRKALSVPQQYIAGVLILTSGIVFGLLLYYLVSQYTPTVVINMEQYGLLRYVSLINFFFIYFCIVNPIVEEWFWRMFLENVYGSRIVDRLVVLLVFFDIWVCIGFVFVVFIGGLFFSFVTHFVGPVASIFCHAAADTLIILFIAYDNPSCSESALKDQQIIDLQNRITSMSECYFNQAQEYDKETTRLKDVIKKLVDENQKNLELLHQRERQAQIDRLEKMKREILYGPPQKWFYSLKKKRMTFKIHKKQTCSLATAASLTEKFNKTRKENDAKKIYTSGTVVIDQYSDIINNNLSNFERYLKQTIGLEVEDSTNNVVADQEKLETAAAAEENNQTSSIGVGGGLDTMQTPQKYNTQAETDDGDISERNSDYNSTPSRKNKNNLANKLKQQQQEESSSDESDSERSVDELTAAKDKKRKSKDDSDDSDDSSSDEKNNKKKSKKSNKDSSSESSSSSSESESDSSSSEQSSSSSSESESDSSSSSESSSSEDDKKKKKKK
ncbi:hypothetical protein DFA_06931 [Cavenderia fasciculata]|uniref:CAAX prenyl protease 2/Lysostaphin resistance protein A-like domain-containing protein n=1 Tax=Cavenderia fasciculata TaxID=261658 RepID=F4PX26_CACFS|nr:uncharacterized protein DFA_06931 [Cavenderia fasciculata]EGG19829.1 hypothetical protein DFA_06931 [Cavenderia fasciculata]|eukprot:XP_004358175.1 hypothetical protein DFA_06931 [Cavenderia fasciculata]